MLLLIILIRVLVAIATVRWIGASGICISAFLRITALEATCVVGCIACSKASHAPGELLLCSRISVEAALRFVVALVMVFSDTTRGDKIDRFELRFESLRGGELCLANDGPDCSDTCDARRDNDNCD